MLQISPVNGFNRAKLAFVFINKESTLSQTVHMAQFSINNLVSFKDFFVTSIGIFASLNKIEPITYTFSVYCQTVLHILIVLNIFGDNVSLD